MCEGPERPAVPPVLVAFVAACSLARVLLAAGAPSLPWALGGLGAAVAALTAAWRRGLTGPWPLFCAGACLCVALSCAAALDGQARAAAALASGPVSSLELTTLTDASEGMTGWTCRARARTADGPSGVVWLSTDEPVPLASTVQGVGRFKPVGEDRAARARGQGIVGTVSMSHVGKVEPAPGIRGALARAREAVLTAWDPSASPEHALVAAMACGWRRDLAPFGLDETFSRAGMAHMLAVSGAHLALVASMISAALERTPLHPRLRVPVVLSVTGAYVLFCAAPLSAVRSWAMTAASSGSRPAGRRSAPLASTGAAGLAMCAADPTVSGDLGFLLSFASVTCLCLFGPLARAWLSAPFAVGGRGRRRRPVPLVASLARTLGEGVAAGAVCSAASAPLAASVFSRVALTGPLASALSGPVFAPLMTVGLMALALFSVPVLGPVLEGAASLFALVLEGVAAAAAGLPRSNLAVSVSEPWATVSLLAGAVALYLVWPRPTGKRLAAAAALATTALLTWSAAPFLAPPSVTVLDVGQGDAVLVRDGARAVLVDAGPAGGGLAEALGRHGVRSLDAVVVTHQHDDHYGGLGELAGVVDVGRVMVAQGEGDRLCQGLEDAAEAFGCPVTELCAGDRVRAGGWVLEALWPQEPVDGDENDESLCLLASFTGASDGIDALLTGDAESSVLRQLPRLGPVDLLKVGHHGSEASIDRACAERLSPVLAVASAGEGNPYGHPSRACREELEGSGARFLCTMDVGDVSVGAVREPGGGLRVTAQGPALAVA